jgi:hypothetical protein
LNSISIFVHEVGHYQVSNHTPHLGLWNLMTGNGVGIMNTYERSQTALSWIPVSTEITSSGTYNLSDFETTGESFKIPLQNSQFYVLENRGDVGFYSTKGNWLMPENGLLITKNDYSGILCADHKWSWETTSGSCACSGSAFIYPFNQLQPSNSGLFDMNLFNVCTYNGSSYACRSHDSSYGDAGDIWSIGYNQVFSPWSNPQTENATNGNQVVIDVLQKNQDGSLDILIKYGVTNGEIDTHPSKPILYRPVTIANCNGIYGYPRITWDNNSEPDMVRDNGSARYYIYRAFSTNSGETFSQYSYIATYNDFSPTDTANFIDNGYFNGVRLWCLEEVIPPAEYNVYYRYRLVAVDKEEYLSVMSDFVMAKGRSNLEDKLKNIKSDALSTYSLNQNYPNPFNPSTEIKYALPVNGLVKIAIYDLLGREVQVIVNEYKDAGYYEIRFDGTNFASGIYFYRIEAGNFIQSKKMLLIK